MANEDNDFAMQAVTGSSQISAVGYNEPRKQMRVEFVSGAVYDYDGVDFAVYGEMMAAPSVGSYFHSRIKQGGYPYNRVG